MPQFPEVTLAILAGGKARRMGGFPKGLLVVAGRTVVERLLALAPDFADALIVANDPGPYAHLGTRIVADRVPGRGPPGGLHAALRSATTPWVLLVACDMPFVTPEAARLLLARRAAAPEASWLMFERGGRPEPLFALYRASLAEAVERRLADNPSMLAAVGDAPGVRVPEAELHGVDPELRSLEGLNTPEEAERAGAEKGGDGGGRGFTP